MALITLEEAKKYLRVDSSDEDALTGILLSSAEQLCVDVARMSQEQWAAVNAEEDTETDPYTETELEQVRSVMRVAVLYALGYLFEHREEADHHALTLTLRSVLFAVREGVNF
ncbi:MAG: head-tail connector protein [Eubacteriales bacterium]|nr:head-tail connector protein [Eubacteriales bacterium]